MLTIRRTRVLRGPNIWAPVPVIMLEVAIGELEERLQRETPVFFEPLVALLPSLETHRATVGNPELGFARLLLPEIALALQQQAGAMVHLAQTHPTDVPGRVPHRLRLPARGGGSGGRQPGRPAPQPPPLRQ